MILRTRFVRWTCVFAVAIGLAVGTAGAAGATATRAGQPKLASATLNGSGSTFAQAFIQAMIQGFKPGQPNVTINYGAGGSGKGRQDFADQVVQYAGTDAPYSATGAQPKGAFDYIPTVTAPITVSYNLPGVKGVTLSADTIAGIFEGQITTWNDPAIKADNPKVNLPSTKITIARRSDSSGTTQDFTTYLQLASPTKWTLGAGATVAWPASSVGGNGNGGVSQVVKGTEGAIGYVDFSDAKAAGLVFASVKNSSGQAIKPSLPAATAALTGLKLNPDLTYNPLNTKAKNGYPITAPTYILVYQSQSDANVAKALKAWLTFVETTGQKLASQVNYAPLPPAFTKAALNAINKIQGG